MGPFSFSHPPLAHQKKNLAKASRHRHTRQLLYRSPQHRHTRQLLDGYPSTATHGSSYTGPPAPPHTAAPGRVPQHRHTRQLLHGSPSTATHGSSYTGPLSTTTYSTSKTVPWVLYHTTHKPRLLDIMEAIEVFCLCI